MNRIKYSMMIVSIIIATSIPISMATKNNLKDLEESISKNNTKDSAEIYNDLTNIEREEGVKLFLTYIIDLEGKVEQGVEEPKVAIERLNDIGNIKEIDNDVKRVRENIDELENSHIAFNRAERAEEEKNYKEALDNYNYVRKEDKKNYAVAKNKIKEIKNKLEN